MPNDAHRKLRNAANCLLLAACSATACNIPVFRYALERWSAEPYEALIFHRGPLSADEQALVRQLAEPVSDQGATANLEIRLIDVSRALDPATGTLWQRHSNAPLPRLVLRYVESGEAGSAVWAGPLAPEPIRVLLDSPARQETSRRLLRGESAVWLLLEGSDREKNDAAAGLLATELQRLEKTLELPPPLPDDPDLRSPLPLRINFSVLRVSRQAPAEAAFGDILCHGEPKLAAEREPVLFPVFGRGRVLGAFVGPDINAKLIEDMASFVCGICSCEVKSLNPGFDLLLAVDWDSIFQAPDTDPAKPQPPQPAPAKVAAPVLATASPAPVPFTNSPPGRAGETRAKRPRTILWAGLVVSSLLAVVTGIFALRSTRRG